MPEVICIPPTKATADRKLRMAAYARVSTDIRDEVENRSDNREIEQKCAEIHRKISQLKTELQAARTKKQAVDAGNGRIRAVCEALDNMEQEFAEYNDTVVRRLISRIRVVSAEKLICTYCGSLDLEQGL